MIIKFKLFENINEGEPKVGDYVICNTKYLYKGETYSKINNSIGIITEIRLYNLTPYKIYYPDLNISYEMFRKCIDYWSKNKENLTKDNIEFYKDVKNFNL